MKIRMGCEEAPVSCGISARTRPILVLSPNPRFWGFAVDRRSPTKTEQTVLPSSPQAVIEVTESENSVNLRKTLVFTKLLRSRAAKFGAWNR
jgi:hypothetical protein